MAVRAVALTRQLFVQSLTLIAVICIKMFEELFLKLSEYFSVYSLLFSSFLTSLGFHVFPCLSLLTLREGLFCASDPRHDQTNRFLDFLVAVSQQLREYMWICFRPQFFCLGQRVFCLNYVKIEFVLYGNFIRVLLSDSILFLI